ncbi:MAG TPA: hypothetical protein VN086_02935, partial [Candidatus Paceibacterota bacterium]|nr:hypothetical protein [Candidatus Paceibacterota bacterium]
MRLADFLLDSVFPPRETELIVREASYERLMESLSPVVRGQGRQASVSLFSYADPCAKACIVEAKFEDNMRAAELLGGALYEFLYEFLAEHQSYDVASPFIIPLPLSADRLRERGYNQTERIVHHALRQSLAATSDTSLLIRTRPTVPQTSLTGRARQTNVSGAFATTSPCDPYR